MRRTKIVATIGPASGDEDTLARMIEAGMDVARLNFSHGNREIHAENARRIRSAAGMVGRQVAILQDLSARLLQALGQYQLCPDLDELMPEHDVLPRRLREIECDTSYVRFKFI